MPGRYVAICKYQSHKCHNPHLIVQDEVWGAWHLAQETRSQARRRFSSKLAITKQLYEKGYGREDVINLFGFIDWVMSLPAELEQEFQQQIQQLEAERRMPYITSIERSGIRQGLLKGIGSIPVMQIHLLWGSCGAGVSPEKSLLQIQGGQDAIGVKLRKVVSCQGAETQSVHSA